MFDSLVCFSFTGIKVGYQEELADNPFEQGIVFALSSKFELCVQEG